MWPCEPAAVCALTSMRAPAKVNSGALLFLHCSRWNGVTVRSPEETAEAETLTAATCHISQVKFGGNQFRALIRSMTPTPAAAEESWPAVASCPDESQRTQVINLKSPPPS